MFVYIKSYFIYFISIIDCFAGGYIGLFVGFTVAQAPEVAINLFRGAKKLLSFKWYSSNNTIKGKLYLQFYGSDFAMCLFIDVSFILLPQTKHVIVLPSCTFLICLSLLNLLVTAFSHLLHLKVFTNQPTSWFNANCSLLYLTYDQEISH